MKSLAIGVTTAVLFGCVTALIIHHDYFAAIVIFFAGMTAIEGVT